MPQRTKKRTLASPKTGAPKGASQKKMRLPATVRVRRATRADLPRIAEINAAEFTGNRDNLPAARRWVRCWLRAFPLYQYFVIERAGRVVGYIGWQVHGGFLRSDPCLELEQVALDKRSQGQGLFARLIEASFAEMWDWLLRTNRRISSHVSVTVWGYSLNFDAMKAYAGEFGDGVQGMRTMYGDRSEVMLRMRRMWMRGGKPGRRSASRF